MSTLLYCSRPADNTNRQHTEYESLIFANPHIRSTCFKMKSLKDTVNHHHIPGFDARKTLYWDFRMSLVPWASD